MNGYFPNRTVPLPQRSISLTVREAQILALIADGTSNAAIAQRLYITVDTVKTYNRRIFRKLNANDRAHAVAQAFRAGVLQ
ncbi:DNA-binding NarL/FixJ family response regulator [Actinoplanes campanulatus]|uniref:DNA-binding NarL/FixJ family response regulator n=1 Tax=Actinoplanes campanulatus TaxID=113559 RepID=A0A7W5FHT7_9ACTN|nr:LuxR C-terminal-related transcriptional regulator [Actinoplanes campanulatus]MBB3098964.1 DNA-binding NarL/FixJ family response regulator [Actinoplanes campanulatus]GGN39665.1 hypothetical protein GCM10010109_67860 [Actinoplanes campanulatus]